MSASNQPAGPDSRTMMLYDAGKKSVLLSYLLWLFLGTVGGHRLYNRRIKSALVMILLTVVGAATAAIGVGLPLIAFVGLWTIVDAFLIPGWVREQNMRLIGLLDPSGRTAALYGTDLR